MKTICIATQKGGTGKTTTALAIGCGLSEQGNKVLFIDLDPQCNLSFVLGGISERNITNIFDFPQTIKTAIRHTQAYDYISSSQYLNASKVGKNDLKTALNYIVGIYDYCIIDCAPRLDQLTITALTCADGVIVPVNADRFSYTALEDFYNTFQTVKESINNKLQIYGIVPTQYNNRATLSKQMLTAFQSFGAAHHIPVLNPVRKSIAVQEAQALQEASIYKYAAKSTAAADYNKVLYELKEIIKNGK